MRSALARAPSLIATASSTASSAEDHSRGERTAVQRNPDSGPLALVYPAGAGGITRIGSDRPSRATGQNPQPLRSRCGMSGGSSSGTGRHRSEDTKHPRRLAAIISSGRPPPGCRQQVRRCSLPGNDLQLGRVSAPYGIGGVGAAGVRANLQAYSWPRAAQVQAHEANQSEPETDVPGRGGGGRFRSTARWFTSLRICGWYPPRRADRALRNCAHRVAA